jgi:hypothetical protein
MKFRFLFLYASMGLLALVTWGGVLPLKAKASSPSDISVTTSPENPAPNENVDITLSSYTYDLNSVKISWSVNGEVSSSGIGQKSFSVISPSLGKETMVVATISLPDGDLNETIPIKPAILTLLWQANDSYVPPFYEGKAMPSPDSEIKVVAMPEIKNSSRFVDPTNMTYDWQLDQTNDAGNSGYGKNSYVYASDYLDNSNDVSVTATTLDGNDSVNGSVNISTVSPKIDFYINDPTFGTLWENALSDGYQVSGNQIIQAAPYFISPKDLRIPFLTWTWSINDQQISVLSYDQTLLPIQTQAGIHGTSNIDLEVSNAHSLVNTASKEINVNF